MSSPVRTTKVPAAIAHELRREINRGDRRPGERLPSHRELSTRFQASLGSVREAINTLIAEGLIETRVGSGTFIAGNPAHSASASGHGRLLDRAAVEELLEARELLESHLVVLAANRCTEADIARLRAAITEMEASVTDPTAYAEADIEFHLILAGAARNQVLLRWMIDIRGLLRREMELSAEVGARRHGDLSFSIEFHRQVVDALVARDAATARELLAITMRRHHGFVLSLYPPREQERDHEDDMSEREPGHALG